MSLRMTEDQLAAHLGKFPRKPSKVGESMGLSEALIVVPKKKRHKFNAQVTVVQGRKFRSGKEARRYEELLLLLKSGAICKLECQPEFVMHAENDAGEWIAVGKYRADFRYQEHGGFSVGKDGAITDIWRTVIEDVKGGNATKTEAYKLRKRKVEAEYSIVIVEV